MGDPWYLFIKIKYIFDLKKKKFQSEIKVMHSSHILNHQNFYL